MPNWDKLVLHSWQILERKEKDIINEAVKYAIEAEDFDPLVDSEWEEYYDEDTLAEIRKRLQMYYFDHPEEHERIWDKYYKQDKRTWPEKGLLALELVGGAFSVYSGIGLVGSALGAIGGGVGGSLALAGGGTVSGASSVAVSDLLVGAVGIVGSIAGGDAIVHGINQIAETDDYYKKGRPEGGNPREDKLVRKDKAKVKSNDFKEFLEKEGENPNNWKKIMETWETPEGEFYERHYWTNGIKSYYHN